MDVNVDRAAGRVYIGLRDLPPGVTGGVTHYLEKHGLLLYWDGSGTLTGLEVSAPGEPVRVREE